MDLVLRPDYLCKPPTGSQVDYGHELAAGLTSCYLLNEGLLAVWDSVRNKLAPPRGTHNSVAADGITTTALGNNFGGWNVPLWGAASANPFTIQVLASWTTTLKGCFVSEGSPTQYQSLQLVANNVTAGDLNIYLTTVSGYTSNIATNTIPGPYNNGNVHNIIWICTGQPGTTYLYVDGELMLTSAVTGGAFTSTTQQSALCAAIGSSGLYFQFEGVLHSAAIWNRALSNADALWLSNEPYAYIRHPHELMIALSNAFIAASAAFRGQASLAQVARIVVDGGAVFDGRGVLSAAGLVVNDVTLDMIAHGELAAGGRVVVDTSARLVSVGRLNATGQVVMDGSLHLVSLGKMSVAGRIATFADAVFTGHGLLGVTTIKMPLVVVSSSGYIDSFVTGGGIG